MSSRKMKTMDVDIFEQLQLHLISATVTGTTSRRLTAAVSRCALQTIL
jgi:galactitol-specific phosphotransferase system IIC component